MPVPEVLIVAGILLGWALIYMTAWWVASVVMRRTDVADVGWGLGFVTFAWWGALLIAPEPIGVRVWFMAAFVTVWGVRLAWHIATRNFAPGRREDVRYAEMRLRWGSAWPLRSLLTVFLLQGALMWIVASPITVVLASTGPPFGWLDVVAVAAWTAGIAFEALGDAQLREWLAEPTNRGRPLTTGVWGWTRHPNYFGDALAWWGIGLLALSMPYGAFGLVGPAVMTLLLRFVSGVPPLEKRHVGDPEWDAYRRRTPVFWPWPPKRP